MDARNDVKSNESSLLSQDNESALSDVMTGDQYMKLDPLFCVPYTMIRELSYSKILRLVSVFTGQGSPKLGPAGKGNTCGTSTVMVVDLVKSELHCVSIYSRDKGLSKSSIQTKLSAFEKLVWHCRW